MLGSSRRLRSQGVSCSRCSSVPLCRCTPSPPAHACGDVVFTSRASHPTTTESRTHWTDQKKRCPTGLFLGCVLPFPRASPAWLGTFDSTVRGRGAVRPTLPDSTVLHKALAKVNTSVRLRAGQWAPPPIRPRLSRRYPCPSQPMLPPSGLAWSRSRSVRTSRKYDSKIANVSTSVSSPRQSEHVDHGRGTAARWHA